MGGGHHFRRFAGGRGEIRQGLFMAGDKGEDPGQKARFRRRRAQGSDFEPGQAEKTRQQLGIAGQKAKGLDGDGFGLVAGDRAGSCGAKDQGGDDSC